jgi:hypothetical protein
MAKNGRYQLTLCLGASSSSFRGYRSLGELSRNLSLCGSNSRRSVVSRNAQSNDDLYTDGSNGLHFLVAAGGRGRSVRCRHNYEVISVGQGLALSIVLGPESHVERNQVSWILTLVPYRSLSSQ